MGMLLTAIRSLLALEGVVMSRRALASTRQLEKRRENGDQSVKDAVGLSPQSRLFQIPNPLIAIVYFATITFLSASGLVDKKIFRPVALVAAWVSLSSSGYFLFQLWFVMKRNCPLCIRTHTLNLALTLAITARAAGGNRSRR